MFKIQSGVYDGVDLSGSVFVLANLPRAERQAPVADTLFLGTNDAKKGSAIENSLHRLFGLAPRKVLRTSIQYHESGAKQTVEIPGLLLYKISFEGRQILSADVSENLYPWLSNSRQGIAKAVVYSPAVDRTVKYGNTNAISGDFHILVPEM